MKYFIDHEFLEGPQKEKFPISLFRKQTPNTIDLISIGIVAEDGREYYAISKDFNLKEAWNRFDLEQQSGDMRNIFPEGRKVYWLRENVLRPIYDQLILNRGVYEKMHHWNLSEPFSYQSIKYLLGHFGKTNKEIVEEVKNFTQPMYRSYSLEGEKRFTHGSVGCGISPPDEKGIENYGFKFTYPPTNPEFYAYYADYDWVVFCWLFGKMIDLPKGFPMYCKDLKQMLDEYAFKIVSQLEDGNTTQGMINIKNSIPEQIKAFKTFPNFQKQDPSKSHNAIEDARWNKQLFEFLAKR
ncbi:MAG: 3'-5' exoribonuclease [Flavobacterium sp.]|nr:3'-5' exoribonuclease [Flavobacterium sp.]